MTPSHNSDKERILCAAIWYDDGVTSYVHQPKNIMKGYVICGMRHHNCIATHVLIIEKSKSLLTEEAVQGFLTTKNRFVDRRQAMIIAKEAGQVPTNQSFEELFSEDLY